MLNAEITVTEAPSYSVDIHIAGDLLAARMACREFCLTGLCVTVAAEDFVYTGGMETGVRVGIINYPRFPKLATDILATAIELARFLIVRLHQQSCCVVAPDGTHWLSRRSWS